MNYSGGKGSSFRHILNLIPPHDVYIETHLGGGSVLRNKRPGLQDIGIDRDPKVIEQWKSRFGSRYDVRQGNAHQFLDSYTFTGNEVVYVDPPYFPETRIRSKIYRHDYSAEDHHELLEILVRLPARVIVSGYSHFVYEKILRDWNKMEYSAQTHSGVRTECLWFNFESPSNLHDYRFIGSDFRDRERVRRKLATLQKKVQLLKPIERQAFLQWMNENCVEDINIS